MAVQVAPSDGARRTPGHAGSLVADDGACAEIEEAGEGPTPAIATTRLHVVHVHTGVGTNVGTPL